MKWTVVLLLMLLNVIDVLMSLLYVIMCYPMYFNVFCVISADCKNVSSWARDTVAIFGQKS